jgi:two-component system chemotaxis response regulator CheB
MILNPQRVARDIIVLGASAGGLEAVLPLLERLPASTPAVLALVMHRGPQPSRLACVLARRALIRVVEPSAGESLQEGCLYLAPPDRHLVFEGDGLQTVAGAKEHSARPAIDPLFESAARIHRERVIGVVLSGSGTDGTSGLRAIKDAGGITLVQDLLEAGVRFMPASAIQRASPDATLGVSEIAVALEELARGRPYVTTRG